MNLFASMFRRARERRAYGDLLHLNDRLLRDIGLTRSDVRSLKSRGTRRRPGDDHE